MTRAATSVRAIAIALALPFAFAGCSAAPQIPAPSPTSSEVGETLDALTDAASGLPVLDRVELFDEAVASGRSGVAQKTAAVDARPAKEGEVVVSIIEGDGVETVSPPAQEGDMVVRSNCEDASLPDNGGVDATEILVSGQKFPTRYGQAQSEPDAAGYQRYEPSGTPMRYFIVDESDGEFAIEAPWGELMVVRPGDAIVQNTLDPQDIYRIYGPGFECTYEVTEAAPSR